MKGFVFHGPGQSSWDTVPDPRIKDATDVLGADIVTEAAGVPETFELRTRIVRPGGHVADVGVHGKPAILHLEDLWIRNVTITTGLVDTHSTPTLLRMAADTGALEMVLGGTRHEEAAVEAAGRKDVTSHA